MKGLDALAQACAPEEPEKIPETGMLQLSDDQIDKIAARMIEKLQNTAPEPAKSTPEKAEQEPEPENETGGEEIDD